jgi:hypothetical protein
MLKTPPRTAVVERLLKEHPLLRAWDLELVRKYRIKLSEVLEFQCQSDPEKPLILVKHRLGIVPAERTQENLEKEFRGLKALWNRTASSLDGTMPKPLAYLPEALAIAFEKLPGRSLEKIMKLEGNRLTGPFRLSTFRTLAPRIGQWLHRFHSATFQPPDTHDSSVYLAKVSKWINLCRENGLNAAIAQDVLDGARRASERVEGQQVLTAALHGDLIPINVLVDKGQVAVVDFGGYREREPIYEDLGMFLAYLRLMADSGFYSRMVIKVMEQGFLEGYAGLLSSDLLMLYILKATLDILACQFRAASGSPMRSRKFLRLERYLTNESRRLFVEHQSRPGENPEQLSGREQ